MPEAGRKTDQAHWDVAWGLPVKPRLPSLLNVDVLNLTRLLRKYVTPGCRYIEIGCAPGKLLAWVAGVLRAEASGLDYSATGVAQCRALFDALRLPVKLYEADFFDHRLPLRSFDVVSSFGLIEHFDDARPVVRQHLELVRPGGVAVIAVPNYGGLYGKLQRRCDSANLDLHNVEIMNVDALRALAQDCGAESVRAFPFGNFSPWLVSLEKKLARPVARSLSVAANAVGLVQPATIEALAPLLVLEVRMGRES